MTSCDLGFLGGGQLARMSIQAAQRMGLRCISLDPAEDSPASAVAPAITGRLDDAEAIAQLLRRAHRVTLENEFIPGFAIRKALRLSGRRDHAIVPGVETLELIQDKLLQRETLASRGVPSPRAVPIDPAKPGAAVDSIGFPMVLKARFGGYDGKGTRYARDPFEFETHRPLWSAGGWMAEEFVPFRRELSVIVADAGGRVVELPPMETLQANHVCDLTYPAARGEAGPADVKDVPRAAVAAVGGGGLFGVELFELPDGRVLVNEMAPRPHNTGHYTLDWGALSQFDLHVRLALGLSRPEKVAGQDVAMANLLGRSAADDPRKGMRSVLDSYPDVRVHWYGKAHSRPGRKMGHLNLPLTEGNTIETLRAARELFFST